MSSTKVPYRSSLSFDAPEGVLDMEELETITWEDLQIFDHNEAGIVQQVLTEFANKLNEETQQKKNAQKAKKIEMKKKVAIKLKEPVTSKTPAKVTPKKSKMPAEKPTAKKKTENDPTAESKTKNTMEGKPIVRKTRNTVKQNEGNVGKLKENFDAKTNGPKTTAKKTEGKSTEGNKKIIAKKTSKKVENVENADANDGNEVKRTSGTVSSRKTVVKKLSKIGQRAESVSHDAEIAENNVTKAGKSRGKGRNSSAGTMRIAVKDKKEKNEKSQPQGTLQSAETKEPQGQNESSLHEPSESLVKFTPEEMTELRDDEESSAAPGSVENSVDKSEVKSEKTNTPNLTSKSPKITEHELKKGNFETVNTSNVMKEMTDIKIKQEPMTDSFLKDSAIFESSLHDVTDLHKITCASSTVLYDSAISSCTKNVRGPRISIVARITPKLNETHPPVELKYKLQMPLDGSQPAENLHPKVVLKTVNEKKQKPEEPSELPDQGKSDGNRGGRHRHRTGNRTARRTYGQMLLDRNERRRIRRARRSDRKLASAVQEFSRHIVKMAKRMGHLPGDNESSSSSSSSSSSMSSSSSSATDSADSEHDTSCDCFSDTSYCSCTTCSCGVPCDSDEFTEFSPCSYSNSFNRDYSDLESDCEFDSVAH